jgi:hypothetical protein
MAWSVCAWLQQMQRLQHAANLACMHAWLVHKIFLGMSQGNHDQNSDLLQSKHLVMHNLFLLPCHIGDMREKDTQLSVSLSLSMLVCLCVCTLYRHAEVRPGQNTAAQGKVKSISILWLYISMQHFNISEFQSAGSQTVPGYRVHASMALYAQVLLAWLPSWDVCLCVWHICFKKVSQIKEMCHKLKKKWVHVSSRIDGCIDHHTHIRTHLEQFSRKDMPLLSFSAFTNWNPDLFVSTCTYMCAGLLGCCVCVFCWQ